MFLLLALVPAVVLYNPWALAESYGKAHDAAIRSIDAAAHEGLSMGRAIELGKLPRRLHSKYNRAAALATQLGAIRAKCRRSVDSTLNECQAMVEALRTRDGQALAVLLPILRPRQAELTQLLNDCDTANSSYRYALLSIDEAWEGHWPRIGDSSLEQPEGKTPEAAQNITELRQEVRGLFEAEMAIAEGVVGPLASLADFPNEAAPGNSYLGQKLLTVRARLEILAELDLLLEQCAAADVASR